MLTMTFALLMKCYQSTLNILELILILLRCFMLTYIIFYSSINTLNVSQITSNDDYNDNDSRAQVYTAKCNYNANKPCVRKKDPSKKVSQHLLY